MIFLPNEKFDKSHISKDENEEMVKMIVDELMAEELMDNPFDFFFRSSSDYFPNACHEVLELPGIFEKKLNSSIFSFTGRSLQADYIEKVLPDNKMIFDPAIIIVDHMSYKLDVDKIDSSFEYKMSKIMKSKELCYMYIITNIDYNDEILIKMSHFDHFSIRVIFFDNERIYKMLSMLIKKDYSKHVFSDVDLIRFVYCLIFSKKPFAKEVIHKLVELYVNIDTIYSEYKIYLHSALKTMIKYHFTDEKEIRRLLTMITKAVNSGDMDKIPISLDYEERITELKTEVEQKDNIIFERDTTITEKDYIIMKKDKAIEEINDVIAEKDKAIEEINDVIAEKDNEIKELQKRIELLENGSG